MIQLTEEIYSVLQGLTEDVYYNMLPENASGDSLFIVYELHESASYSAMDGKNYANDLTLKVKILHPDTLELMRVGEDVKELLLNHPFEHCRDLYYNNSVPVFQDQDLNTYQYTLIFSLYSDGSTAGLWSYIKATLQAIKDKFSQYYTKQEVHDYVAATSSTGGVDLTGYATEVWVEGKGYLTQHQSLTGLATETYVNTQISAIPDSVTSEGNNPILAIWTGTQAEYDVITPETNKLYIII